MYDQKLSSPNCITKQKKSQQHPLVHVDNHRTSQACKKDINMSQCISQQQFLLLVDERTIDVLHKYEKKKQKQFLCGYNGNTIAK